VHSHKKNENSEYPYKKNTNPEHCHRFSLSHLTEVCQYFFSYLNTDIRWLADTDTGRKVFAREYYISYTNNNTNEIVSPNKVVRSNTLTAKSAFLSLSFWRLYNSQPVKAQVFGYVLDYLKTAKTFKLFKIINLIS